MTLRGTWLALVLVGCTGVAAHEPGPWVSLLPEDGLGNWSSTSFGGEGEVRREGGALVLEPGTPLTGVTWTGPAPPTSDYELEVVARKLAGNDFFLGLTFPVGDGAATFVLGGWGGALCGLSCLDGEDASSNATKFFRAFEQGRAYRVGVRVEGPRVTCRIDGEVVVDVDTAGRRVSLRTEVEPSAPLGLASFLTRAAYEDIRSRELQRPPR